MCFCGKKNNKKTNKTEEKNPINHNFEAKRQRSLEIIAKTMPILRVHKMSFPF